MVAYRRPRVGDGRAPLDHRRRRTVLEGVHQERPPQVLAEQAWNPGHRLRRGEQCPLLSEQRGADEVREQRRCHDDGGNHPPRALDRLAGCAHGSNCS
jgi:hypothetical protein